MKRPTLFLGVFPLFLATLVCADEFAAPPGTFYDADTALLWQIGENGRMPWSEAARHCRSLFADEGGEWRLPRKDELLSQPPRHLFPDAAAGAYWSATPQNGRVLGVAFDSGLPFAFGGSDPALYVRCVADPPPPFAAPLQTLHRWAQAWSRQDVEAYLSFYSDDFDPGSGLSQAAWKERRRSALGRPEWIEVRIDDLRASRTDAGVRIAFVQAYRSDLFSDRVRKAIDFVPERGGWAIAAEETFEILP